MPQPRGVAAIFVLERGVVVEERPLRLRALLVGEHHGGTQTVTRVTSDGVEQGDLRIPLHDDHNEHWAQVDVGEG